MRSSRLAPSTTGLRALDAVLRTGSLSAAGRELCVTPAAISHRLRSLEAQAGTPLVWRTRGRFWPTDAGAQVVAALDHAFARIRAADAVLRSLDRSQALRVVSPLSFTVLWLLPRLARFEADHPDVTAYVAASSDPLREGGIAPDIRIAHGSQSPDGLDWTRLCEDLTAVAHAPNHEAESQRDPAALLRMRAVHIDTPSGPRGGTLDWGGWARAMGLASGPPGGPPGPHVSAEHAAVDITLQGGTLMLASLVTVADHVAAGRLLIVPGTLVRAGIGYWIAQERPGPVGAAFAAWLRMEMALHEREGMRQGLAQAGP